MGREVRMVPVKWNHPRDDSGQYQPMFDENFDDVFKKWLAEFDRVRGGALTEDERGWYPRGLADWLTDEGLPPDPEYYRHYQDNERAWFQLYETVSEGTPVSPPFATKEELAQHLAVHGDDWDTNRGKGGWGIERARAFVEAGRAPSMMVEHTASGTRILDSKDIPLALSKS